MENIKSAEGTRNGDTTTPGLSYVTIDSENTRDIDDAFWVESQVDGGVKLHIAIANPTKLVKIGSSEDERARRLGATAYIRDQAVSKMLPGRISEDASSLTAGKFRDAFVFEIDMDQSLAVTRFLPTSCKIEVAHRLSYHQIPEIISDNKHPLQPMLNTATTLAKVLLQSRRQRGALALYDLTRFMLSDEEGNLRKYRDADEVIGNILIQEMMVLVNSLIARYMVEHDIPALFRNHQPKISAPTSNELAETIESWLTTGSADSTSVVAQFNAIAGKAKYGASATGHYGLSLPLYLHASSPLRRYADLINMRQLSAHLTQKTLPYKKVELEDIATHLNETLERRQAERKEGFKDVVARTASRAVSTGNLARLADHELSAAVKLSREAGYLPPALINELINRMENATLADSVADRLVFEVPRAAITSPLAIVLGRWLQANPARAMHLYMHGKQIGWFSSETLEVEHQVDFFYATITASVTETGQTLKANGTGSKKRDAEQQAVIRLIAYAIDCPIEEAPIKNIQESEFKKNQPAVNGNPKGKLLEQCQQHGWKTPVFETGGSGPSHRMVFWAKVGLEVDGIQYTGQAQGKTSKKEAEAFASADMLSQLGTMVRLQKQRAPDENLTGNPIGFLQERAQQRKCAMPDYAITQISMHPPEFQCILTTYCSGKVDTFTAVKSSKQEAKKAAASIAYSKVITSTPPQA